MIALKPVRVSMTGAHGDSADGIYEGVGAWHQLNAIEDTTTAATACTPPITEEISTGLIINMINISFQICVPPADTAALFCL